MIHITTNNHERPVIYGFELTDKEKAEFDYYSAEELLDASFFRYKGEVYDLGEFVIVHDKDLQAWDGMHSDTFFSGILVRYAEDTDFVVCGWFYVGSDL